VFRTQRLEVQPLDVDGGAGLGAVDG
jgi:hypothetical protein